MDTNTENLKNLLDQYKKTNSNDNVDLGEKIDKPTHDLGVEKIFDSKKIKLIHSPDKVDYYEYNGYTYRREICGSKVSWEIMSEDISKKIIHDIQIRVLEEKISGINF